MSKNLDSSPSSMTALFEHRGGGGLFYNVVAKRRKPNPEGGWGVLFLFLRV
ncbi:unnamed protein product [Ectocarpus sp. CCAP 1310/34]|nr:unnamed protein product [Ectocarpus sp. CCAP 1310/34]